MSNEVNHWLTDGEAMQDVIPVPVTWPVWQKAYLERRSELQQMTSKGRASSDPEVKRLSYRYITHLSWLKKCVALGSQILSRMIQY